MTLSVPQTLKDRLETPISIYKISADTFQQTIEEETGHTWHATDPVTVVEEKKYASVFDAFSDFGGIIKLI